MATPFPIQSSFTGMVRDLARDGLPSGALWNCVDFVPNILGSPLRKRGGWSYSNDGVLGGVSTSVQAVGYAPFTANLGKINIAIGSDNKLYRWITNVTTPTVGTVFAVIQNPVFHRELLIIPAGDGVTAPKSWDGTGGGAGLINLGGSPPSGKYATVYKDRTLLLGTSANPPRVYFSQAGNPSGTWDTTNSWIDTSSPVTGAEALGSAVLIFHGETVERLRGSIPPPGTDMVLEPLFQVGCLDARSIVKFNDNIIWADQRGVYMTDGATLSDLTANAGIKTYWQQLINSTYSLAGGVIRGHYIITVRSGTTFKDAFLFNLQTRTVVRLGNVNATAFARSFMGNLPSVSSEELLMAPAALGQPVAMSTIFAPASGVKADADGTSVLPQLETAYFRGYQRWHRKWLPAQSLQTWAATYLDYELIDAASDVPTFTLSYARVPDAAPAYTALSPTIPATVSGVLGRVRRPLGFGSSGVAFKLAQTNASADTKLFALEADYEPREASRLT